MPRRKKIKVTRRKNEFSRALQAAKSVLKAKTKQRDRMMTELRQLNTDIPSLERTVRALEAQLGGTGAVGPLTSQTDSRQVGGVPPKVHIRPMLDSESGIPQEVLAQLPPEDFSRFGSHFGEEAPEKEDYLPEIVGKEVIPEKK